MEYLLLAAALLSGCNNMGNGLALLEARADDVERLISGMGDLRLEEDDGTEDVVQKAEELQC